MNVLNPTDGHLAVERHGRLPSTIPLPLHSSPSSRLKRNSILLPHDAAHPRGTGSRASFSEIIRGGKEGTNKLLKLWKGVTKEKEEKGADILTPTENLVAVGEPGGCLIVHIKQCKDFTKHFTMKRYHQMVVRVRVNNMVKCTSSQSYREQSKFQKSDIAIRFEELKYFSVQVPKRQSDERNKITLELIGYEAQAEMPRLLGRTVVHLYEVIMKSAAKELYELKLKSQLVCKIESQLTFCYGNFGYGYSHQLKQQQKGQQENELQSVVAYSAFIRIPPPEHRADPHYNVMTAHQVDYPGFLSPNFNVSLGDLTKEAAGFSSGYVGTGATMKMSPKVMELMHARKRLETLKNTYYNKKTVEERIDYLEKLILKQAPKSVRTSRAERKSMVSYSMTAADLLLESETEKSPLQVQEVALPSGKLELEKQLVSKEIEGPETLTQTEELPESNELPLLETLPEKEELLPDMMVLTQLDVPQVLEYVAETKVLPDTKVLPQMDEIPKTEDFPVPEKLPETVGIPAPKKLSWLETPPEMALSMTKGLSEADEDEQMSEMMALSVLGECTDIENLSETQLFPDSEQLDVKEELPMVKTCTKTEGLPVMAVPPEIKVSVPPDKKVAPKLWNLLDMKELPRTEEMARKEKFLEMVDLLQRKRLTNMEVLPALQEVPEIEELEEEPETKEMPATEEIPEMEEVPEPEDMPDPEKMPDIEEVIYTEEVPHKEEIPVLQKQPATKVLPVLEELPKANAVPKLKVLPKTEVLQVQKKQPMVDMLPVSEDLPRLKEPKMFEKSPEVQKLQKVEQSPSEKEPSLEWSVKPPWFNKVPWSKVLPWLREMALSEESWSQEPSWLKEVTEIKELPATEQLRSLQELQHTKLLPSSKELPERKMSEQEKLHVLDIKMDKSGFRDGEDLGILKIQETALTSPKPDSDKPVDQSRYHGVDSAYSKVDEKHKTDTVSTSSTPSEKKNEIFPEKKETPVKVSDKSLETPTAQSHVTYSQDFEKLKTDAVPVGSTHSEKIHEMTLEKKQSLVRQPDKSLETPAVQPHGAYSRDSEKTKTAAVYAAFKLPEKKSEMSSEKKEAPVKVSDRSLETPAAQSHITYSQDFEKPKTESIPVGSMHSEKKQEMTLEKKESLDRQPDRSPKTPAIRPHATHSNVLEKPKTDAVPVESTHSEKTHEMMTEKKESLDRQPDRSLKTPAIRPHATHSNVLEKPKTEAVSASATPENKKEMLPEPKEPPIRQSEKSLEALTVRPRVSGFSFLSKVNQVTPSQEKVVTSLKSRHSAKKKEELLKPKESLVKPSGSSLKSPVGRHVSGLMPVAKVDSSLPGQSKQRTSKVPISPISPISRIYKRMTPVKQDESQQPPVFGRATPPWTKLHELRERHKAAKDPKPNVSSTAAAPKESTKDKKTTDKKKRFPRMFARQGHK